MGIDKKNKSAPEGSEGSTEWHGGECPVDSDAIVEVKCRWHNQPNTIMTEPGIFTGRTLAATLTSSHIACNSRRNQNRLAMTLRKLMTKPT